MGQLASLFVICAVAFLIVCAAVAGLTSLTGFGYIGGDVYGGAPGTPLRAPFPFDLGDVEVTRGVQELLDGVTYPVVDRSTERWYRPFRLPDHVDVPVLYLIQELHRTGQWDHPLSKLSDERVIPARLAAGKRAWNHNVVCARASRPSDVLDRSQLPAREWVSRPIIGWYGTTRESVYVITTHDDKLGTTKTLITTTPPVVETDPTIWDAVIV